MPNKELQHHVINIEDLFISSSSDESDNIRFRQTSPININHNNDIKIENVAGEQSLIEYTKQHFNSNMRHNDSDDFSIFKYKENYYCSDSPITMSNNNSDDENEDDENEVDESDEDKSISQEEVDERYEELKDAELLRKDAEYSLQQFFPQFTIEYLVD